MVLFHLLLVKDHDQPHLGVQLVHQKLVLNEQLVKYLQDLHKFQFNNHRCLLFSLCSVCAEVWFGAGLGSREGRSSLFSTTLCKNRLTWSIFILSIILQDLWYVSGCIPLVSSTRCTRATLSQGRRGGGCPCWWSCWSSAGWWLRVRRRWRILLVLLTHCVVLDKLLGP